MRQSLYLRLALNDVRRNRGANVAVVTMLVLSAFLIATGAMVMERLVGSMDSLFEQAKPPHFLQMHKGDYDLEALTRFAGTQPGIDAWLIEDMVGFDGSAISWRGPSADDHGNLGDSLMDNLFVAQNQAFDYLLDQTGEVPHPAPGEVFVPVAYQEQYGLKAGDSLTVLTAAGGFGLEIQGFVRDSQMASSMASATRFLVSDHDLAALQAAGGGEGEIIVEYRLDDPAGAAKFQAAYEADGALPKNGQAVTFEVIRLLNTLSDGLVGVALVLVSLVLIVISLLNVRFVIRGTLEDEVREIGAMKAIGLPHKDISLLYLAKYVLMTVVACIVGGILAAVAVGPLTRSIQINYADAPATVWAVAVPVLALAAECLLVIAVCRGVLRSIRKIEVVNSLVHGSTLSERQTARRARRRAKQIRHTNLGSFGGRHINGALVLLDLRAERGRWVLVPVVFLLSTLVMVLPTSLLNTIESPRFITYMGAQDSDLRADVQFSDDVDAAHESLVSRMRADGRLTAVRDFAQVLYDVRGREGWEKLRVEIGEGAGGGIEYVEGLPPEAGQIALSVLNAEKHQVGVGDHLDIGRDDGASITVSGIYQDVTSGGYTAKMRGEVTSGAMSYVIYADTAQDADPVEVAAWYREQYGAAVVPMREYVQQTLSYITQAFRSAATLSFFFAAGIAVLIATMFLRLQLSRDRRKLGVLSAIGFSVREISAQFRAKMLVGVVAGVLLGLLVAATVGESLVAGLVSMIGLGIARLVLMPNPWLVWLAYPLVLILAGHLSAVLVTARLGADTKSRWLDQRGE